ncbi:MAG TPA: purine nucleoside permease [Burkholderiales bacterium]|nr:purine nucleoside permease [Burkholderiales bacterium]
MKIRWSSKAALRHGAIIASIAGASFAINPSPAEAANPGSRHAAKPRSVKVLVISMFAPEAQPWVKNMTLTQKITVPGLSAEYPTVNCNTDNVCQMTTGMGYANAASSLTALIHSGKFDLRQTYFLIAGIAGIDPNQGTLGTATWARYVVDYSLQHEIDAREMPTTWKAGYIGIMTNEPGQKPAFDYRTEVFQLNESLLQKVLALTKNAKLDDHDAARKYRANYPTAPANQPPQVIQCDTLSGNTWWHGHHLGERAHEWTKILTDGKGVYCTTQQEDSATLEALTRGAKSKLLDINRVALLRTGANFDRPHPGQSAYDSLKEKSGGFQLSIDNLYLTGSLWVQNVVKNWPEWQKGIPKP